MKIQPTTKAGSTTAACSSRSTPAMQTLLRMQQATFCIVMAATVPLGRKRCRRQCKDLDLSYCREGAHGESRGRLLAAEVNIAAGGRPVSCSWHPLSEEFTDV